MKKKREKLFCDKLADDNKSWIDKIGKVVDEKEIIELVFYPDMLKKSMDMGIAPDKLVDFAHKSMMGDRNIEQFTKILCVNNWFWGGRQIYKFDDTLSELLKEQTKSDLCIDISVLEQLPVSHFYVFRKSGHSEGFFFSWAGDMLYIANLSENQETDITYTFRVESGKPISEIVGNDFAAEYGEDEREKCKNGIREIVAEISEYLQFVVYLSAVNAEITPVTKGAVVKRQAGKREYKPRERSEQSEVGYKIGAAIRKSLSSREKVVYVGEHSKGSPKSPHIRRSHFHSYWTGNGDNKELIVKWVNTIFVNGGESENSTVHKVK